MQSSVFIYNSGLKKIFNLKGNKTHLASLPYPENNTFLKMICK